MKPEGKIEAFVKFGELAGEYGRQYREFDFSQRYPANQFRLRIVLGLLEAIRPARTLDVGCGTGEPLLAMLRAGFDVRGFDFAPEMVEQARRTLAEGGFPQDLVARDDMENVANFEKGAFDCAAALGAVYYARDFERTMRNVIGLLKPEGHFIFSLRNDLMSLFSLNSYTLQFMWRDLLPTARYSEGARERVLAHLTDRLGREDVERRFKTIDDLNVRTTMHNPLTVEREVLKPLGLELRGLYYYHFHAMPPALEHVQPEEFRRLSAELENPTDWRGAFMASAFVVHAQKRAGG